MRIHRSMTPGWRSGLDDTDFGVVSDTEMQNLEYLPPIFQEAKLRTLTQILEANYGAEPPLPTLLDVEVSPGIIIADQPKQIKQKCSIFLTI